MVKYIELRGKNLVILLTTSALALLLLVIVIPLMIVLPHLRRQGIEVVSRHLPIPLIVNPLLNTLMTVGFSLSILPLAIVMYINDMYVSNIEDNIPIALRALADTVASGIPLPRAIEVIARGRYGALSLEMRNVVSQILLGKTFEEAIQYLSRKFPTPIIKRFVTILIEAYRSGGRVAQVLHAAANVMSSIRAFETEKRTRLKPYVSLLYMITYIYVLVGALIVYGFVESIETMAAKASGFLQVAITTEEAASLLHFGLLVQCIISGAIIGKILRGRAVLGIPHMLIMLSTATVLYYMILPPLVKLLIPIGAR